MIVRAVLDHPELVDKFDYFNDTRDTLGFLRRVNTPESLVIAARLEQKDREYWDARMKAFDAVLAMKYYFGYSGARGLFLDCCPDGLNSDSLDRFITWYEDGDLISKSSNPIDNLTRQQITTKLLDRIHAASGIMLFVTSD